jgi:hypothetical protein
MKMSEALSKQQLDQLMSIAQPQPRPKVIQFSSFHKEECEDVIPDIDDTMYPKQWNKALSCWICRGSNFTLCKKKPEEQVPNAVPACDMCALYNK